MREDIFRHLNTHTSVSRETFDRLFLYHDLLLKWQPKINLIGPDTIPDIWNRHFLDSLQLIHSTPDLSKKIIDLGTGAGFPGMALAIYGFSDVHVIESDGKKIIFLKEVARITQTKITIHHCRIEEQPIKNPDIFISRALTSVDNILSLSYPYISHETICLFHKGKNYTKEILDAEKKWVFDKHIISSITDKEGAIVKLASIKKRVT